MVHLIPSSGSPQKQESTLSSYYESLKGPPRDSLNSHTPKEPNWKSDVWNVKTSPKTNIFLWKVLRGAIPLGDQLRTRKINPDAKCPFCGEEETVIHLFFHCRFAAKVWSMLPVHTPINPDNMDSIQTLLERAKFLLLLPPCGKGDIPVFPWLIWGIWIARNRLIFKERTLNPSDTLTQALVAGREWNTTHTLNKSTPGATEVARQIRSDASETTCNTDAAWRAESRCAGLGWIFNKDKLDYRIEGQAQPQEIRSPLLAEVFAIYLALSNAATRGL
ncbi:PREDICTED: uncharacterized protein LOC104728651 [Camelina sativa]|uniref:Uncharacterized protein LOC104728651 n=1 Tax=Camelina sativa TaxID=90675 RepID=A0ABM0UT51_CAMSA|nr:PREDICTED: uncharacterized protein LOC104728651 [Camelina sativa]